ncbi:protocadherin-7-like isoform X1 [Babylonia areolata]|uniref:protocadherin-7-like isoform X1 n=1 Tax=Babylonia areolata TaxID=304850 RepID=UPI003FD3A4B9
MFLSCSAETRITMSSSMIVLLSYVLFLCLVRVTEQATVTYQLREEQESGTFVGNIERDMLIRGELDPQDAFNLKYTLSSAGKDGAALFSMNETSSTITTASRIDREEVCPGEADCQIKLSIAVYKRGKSLDLFKLWNAEVNINDINDNSPTFPQPYVSLSVPESVPPPHVLHTSGAEDRDKGGSNSVQEYRLSPPSSLFDLNVGRNPDGSADLGIVIKQQLDREVTESYLLRVMVTDGGFPQRTGSLTINITVADINDNRPKFFRGTYNVTVRENVSPGETILHVSATDLDKGPNGDITYAFSSRVTEDVRTHLQIDEYTGIISARGPIDYEERKHYQFSVEARDSGNPSMTGTAAVILNILDVNDNAPQININLTPGGSNLTEDEAVGKFIAHVSVSDRDSGQNSVVICSMEDDHFSLNKFYDHANNMYKVLLSHALDFETSSSHRVTITCRDTGSPPLANSTGFLVHVRDVNDNAPVFSQNTYTASVIENQLQSQALLQVSAHDYDTGPAGMVEFYLDHTPNISRIFTMDPLTGVLRVRSPLNREDHGRYRFHVLASDLGMPRLTSSAAIVINVQDQNDEKPYFTKSLFDCYIMERQPAGTRVGNVSAVDLDSSRHSRMEFSIVPGVGDAKLFSVEPHSGVLKSRAVFDREVRPVFRFRVKVQDPRVPLFYDLANVTVQVLDDNDNPPVIHYPRDGNNSLNVSYGINVGTLIAAVNATDQDDGAFGRLTFYLVDGDPTRLFELDKLSGGLRLARSLLPSDVKTHVLELQVEDGGDPPLFHNAELHVHVVAGNMTLVAGLGQDRRDKNIVIVIVLVCVTVVLALAVLITICLIRRIDKERQGRRAAAAAKAEEEKMFHLKNQATFMLSLSPADSGAAASAGDSSSSAGGKNNRKKEVSFTIDEGVDSLNTSSASGNMMSTFKSPLDRHRDWSSGENCLSMSGGGPAGTKNEPSVLDISLSQRASNEENHLYTGSGPQQESEEGLQYMERLKRNGEDALSESSGETGTSDSGRGGSEDDSHSNRGSSNIDPEGPAIYPPVSHVRGLGAPSSGSEALPSGRGRHLRSSGGGGGIGGFHHLTSASGRPVRQHSPHVSFSGNLEYLGETSTEDAAEFSTPPAPPDLIVESPPPPATADRNFSSFGSPQPRQGHSYCSVLHTYPGNYQGYGGVSTSLVKNSVSPAPVPAPPLVLEGAAAAAAAAGGRRRWGSPSSNEEDDRTTSSASSGSYVINPEDLRKEMNEMILNDMIV